MLREIESGDFTLEIVAFKNKISQFRKIQIGRVTRMVNLV